MRKRRKTAGELSLKARSDTTKYDPLEVGHALTDDIGKQLEDCIVRHIPKINEDEFCVVILLVDDPLIKGVLRRKFYAWPYLPSPRPRQSVFLYRKRDDSLIRLWVLPNAGVMAVLSEMKHVPRKWQTQQAWSIAFFQGTFWEYIRYEHGIDMLSEKEYLHANREKLIQAGCKKIDSSFSEPFDFSKITIDKIVDTKTALVNEDI